MKPIHAYVTAVTVAAAVVATRLDWAAVIPAFESHWLGLGLLFFFGLLSESFTVRFADGGSSGTHTVTFLPLLATVLLFDPTVAVLSFGLTGAVAEFLIRRKPGIRAIFNVSQYVLATALAGVVYQGLGGISMAGLDTLPSDWLPNLIQPFLGFGLVFFGINHAAVSLALAISQDSPFREIWRDLIGKSGAGVFSDLLVSPIAILIAIVYHEFNALGLLIAFLPLYFIRHAYLQNYRLVQANQDLLTALIKAIETRDPYTSGHSQRVAALARKIAEGMGLSRRKAADIERAALLHDIGKIDSVYTDILRKPDHLTDEERGIIESHVTKGVELLDSLSSFSDEVVESVRHHHERVDGKGYPSGLSGDEISIGGKIIKVCDAIDAMLSDRPYRQALQMDQVLEQLDTYAGLQFDREVVRTVIDNDILAEHLRKVRESGARTGTARDSTRPGKTSGSPERAQREQSLAEGAK